MRLWLRLTLLMGLLTLVPLVVTGSLAVRAATENATLRPEEQMSRDASTLAIFAGMWVDAQARTMAGWQRVWDVRARSEDHQLGLLRAVWQAMDHTVTVALIDEAGHPVVPAVYLTETQIMGAREPGSPARADMLLGQAPKRMNAEGFGVGDPYLPPGATWPVVPVIAGVPGGKLRMLAEISLSPVARVFAGRSDSAAVLVDGFGRPVLGGDHPLLGQVQLSDLLDFGEDLTFTADTEEGLLQGAIWSVPQLEWKVVVLSPPSVAERAAAEIRQSTVLVAGLALLVVVLLGLMLERTVTRSIQALRQHASSVTHGAYEQRNDVDRADELGELGLALNVMSTRLELHRRELEAFQDELQDRVAARTADLEAAQAQLVRAGQVAAVAEMGAGLAHELNNPLAALLGQVQLVRAGLAPDEEVALDRIEAHAQRVREVVEEIARVSAGEISDMATGRAELGSVLREAVEAVRPSFAGRGVTLTLLPAEGPVEARVDPSVVRRVLGHLLESLCAGLDGGTSLTVRALRDGDQAAVRLEPSRAVGVAHGQAGDDWRAAGMRLWTARGLVDLVGGTLREPDASDASWRAQFAAVG